MTIVEVGPQQRTRPLYPSTEAPSSFPIPSLNEPWVSLWHPNPTARRWEQQRLTGPVSASPEWRQRDGKLLEHQLRMLSPGNSCYAKHSEVEFTVTVNNR